MPGKEKNPERENCKPSIRVREGAATNCRVRLFYLVRNGAVEINQQTALQAVLVLDFIVEDQNISKTNIAMKISFFV